MIGDRFTKDGKTYEITSEGLAVGYRLVREEEAIPEAVFEVTPEPITPDPVEEPIVEEPVKRRRRTKK